jgi:cation transport ATPase
MSSQPKLVCWVLLCADQPIVWIRFEDYIRQSSGQLITALKLYYKVSLLSGDRKVVNNRSCRQ